jgi:phospholipid/cholesterol/gamma-HCH transport system substrate-binding protein
MDRSPVRDFIVGLFVLIGLGAIAYLSISIGGFSWHVHGGLKVSADFDETGDLNVRAPVVIGGVHVGEVSKISLDKDFRARVDLDLDPKLQLPIDTSAAIVTAGMLGDRYIELTPGGDEKNLKTGDVITHVDNAVILEKLIGQLVYGVTKGQAADKPASTSAAKGP